MVANVSREEVQALLDSYDSDGNELGNGALAFGYNVRNQTTSTTAPGGSQLGMTYQDASQDRRMSAGSATFGYNVLGLGKSDSPGTTRFARDNRGTLAGELTSTGNYYYLFDALGSVAGLTDAAGNLVGAKTYKYDPFGGVLDAPTTVSNPWRFASGYYEGDRPGSTGLYKFGTRYYDPLVGRWTQPDPKKGQLSNPMALNPYIYVTDDPTNYRDPSGTFSIPEEFDFGEAWVWAEEHVVNPLLAVGITGLGLYAAFAPEIGCFATLGVTGVGLAVCGGIIAMHATIGAGFGYATYETYR